MNDERAVGSEPGRSGPTFEDLVVGDVRMSSVGRTVTETDNTLFTHLSLNTNEIHFNSVRGHESRFGACVVNSLFTLAVVTGLSTADTSQRAICNLEWQEVKLKKPVLVGDTLWAETEILDKRASRTNPAIGIVTVRTRGLNQRGEVVLEFRRSFMIATDPVGAQAMTPRTEEPWGV
jgi:itaconyl-CoA hydratase